MSISGVPQHLTPPEWRCPTVRWHRPKAHYRELHHVWPKEYGGPEDGPLVGICGSCHNEVHGLIRLAKRNGWILTADLHPGYAERVVALALLGVSSIATQSLPLLPDWAKESAR